MSTDDQSETAPQQCEECGEVMRGHHDCAKVIEARALFEAAKRANDPLGARRLGKAAYDLVVEAECVING